MGPMLCDQRVSQGQIEHRIKALPTGGDEHQPMATVRPCNLAAIRQRHVQTPLALSARSQISPYRFVTATAYCIQSNILQKKQLDFCSPGCKDPAFVKNGFRNVPRFAVDSPYFAVPSHSGMDTYCLEDPENSRGTVARLT